MRLDPTKFRARQITQIPVLQSAACAPNQSCASIVCIQLTFSSRPSDLPNVRYWCLYSNTYLLPLTTRPVRRSTVRYVSISNPSLSRASQNQHLKYIQSQRRGIDKRKKEQQSCYADSEATRPHRGNWCYCTSLSPFDRGVDNAAPLAAPQDLGMTCLCAMC